MIEIPLDGRTWEIHLPSRAVQQDVLVASGTNAERARAAALGFCLVEAGTFKTKKPVRFYPELSYLAVGCSALAYGGGIIDEGYRRGIPTAEFAAAQQQCLDAIDDAFDIIEAALPGKGEVEAAEGFTDQLPASGTE